MRIIGPDDPVFGVDDLEGSITYLTDFGPKPVQLDASGRLFETLDGTGVITRPKGGPKLPAPNELGVTDNMPAPPRSLSHVMLFVPGMDKHDDTWVAREALNGPGAAPDVPAAVAREMGPRRRPRGRSGKRTWHAMSAGQPRAVPSGRHSRGYRPRLPAPDRCPAQRDRGEPRRHADGLAQRRLPERQWNAHRLSRTWGTFRNRERGLRVGPLLEKKPDPRASHQGRGRVHQRPGTGCLTRSTRGLIMAAVQKVLVIGGGFSGMSAAIMLARGGVETDLVEISAGWRS
ncbi:hypothetical protein [Salipiger mangrovisoli]|nr:hypothetical protein [Salipiger mangrovisoli]